MRSLVILRGCPGSGKSTWIKENHLENYTICADDLRMLMESPIMVETEQMKAISQKNDKYVWQLLFELLEKRMSRGEFVVIDATHSRSSDFSRYNNLCERYRYRKYYVDFTDVPIEVCKKRNLQRESYKRVPESVIDKMYARFQTQGKTSGWVKVSKDYFWEEISVRLFDMNKYNRIHIFGDIHGCLNPLKEYFTSYPYNEDDMYIFCGDYIDRGLQNKETLEFLMKLSEKKNTLFLEGNHECITTDTEILTENGWKFFDDIDDTELVAQYDIDTDLISYAFPNKRIDKFSNEVVSLKGHNFEQHVTKGHNLLYDNTLISFNDLKDININKFKTTVKNNSVGVAYDNNLLRLMTWIVCDGTIIYGEKDFPNNHKCRVQFKLSKQIKIDKLEKLLCDMNIKYSKHKCKKSGVNKLQPYVIGFYGDNARWIYNILGKEKLFPKNIVNVNKEQLDIILNEIVNTDGHIENNRILWSCINKKNLDLIQLACFFNGYKCNIKLINKTGGFNKKNIYLFTLYIDDNKSNYKKDVLIEELPPQRVVCFNMPKGTLITRTNGNIVVTGNCWLNYYANDEIENIKSKTFLNKTMPEILNLDKKDLRNFYRKIGQMAYFEFDDKIYLVTHGGLSYRPFELLTVATDQMIHGVGDYNVNIDEVWRDNYKISNNTIQVHGHRNTFEINDVDKTSYNLEGRVEFGGNLKVLQLNHNEEPVMYGIKNDYFGKEEINEYSECRSKAMLPTVEQLKLSRDIKETDCGNGISSFNFTRDVFYSKRWNDLTCKARGLYIDTEKDKVVARGYEKFFNVNEVRETKLEHLLVKFKDKKITCYKKENGFLGIMSYVNDELFIVNKRDNNNQYVGYFKTILENSNIDKEKLIEYLKNNNVSLTFEVIDNVNDPHIIKYNESKIVLLDIIHNDYEYKKEPYEEVVKLSKEINCECKSIYKEFDNIRDFHRWYLENTDENDLSKEDIEGVVIECDGIMTKLKFPYYNFWKQMRRLKEQILHKHNIKLSSLFNAEGNYFYTWLKKQDDETLEKDIITLREMYYKDKENGDEII